MGPQGQSNGVVSNRSSYDVDGDGFLNRVAAAASRRFEPSHGHDHPHDHPHSHHRDRGHSADGLTTGNRRHKNSVYAKFTETSLFFAVDRFCPLAIGSKSARYGDDASGHSRQR